MDTLDTIRRAEKSAQTTYSKLIALEGVCLTVDPVAAVRQIDRIIDECNELDHGLRSLRQSFVASALVAPGKAAA